MTATDSQKASLKKNGYVHIKGFFDKQSVAQIFHDVKEVFAIQIEKLLGVPVEKALAMGEEDFSALMIELRKEDFELFSNCGKQTQHLVSLHELGTEKKLIALLQSLGVAKPIISVRPCILMNNVGLDKEGDKGKYWRLPTHQDWYYNQGSLNSVTVWTPYTACNKELGSVEYVPGSHLTGLQKTTDEHYGEMTESFADDKFITFDTEPGDIIVFYSLMVHRSGVNSTNRIRWSTQFRFNDLLEPTFIERKFPNPFVYHSYKVNDTPGFPDEETLKNTFA
ncbi:MAG TPA: phytanoyl-CoA dioxygenase family protein [Chitinophagales bacterium]|nr:phytanoyl-CoA dioxygenase family protein [Chitinophagales bacterium]